jgi:4-hydroxy-tetrahydrodipicolinate reductase
MPLNIRLQGASGRLGSAIRELAEAEADLGCTALPRSGDLQGTSFDVLIDVSVPEGLARSAQVAYRLGLPLVCGTTGLDAAAMQSLRELARRVPVLHARNFSLGVAAMRRAAGELARLLDWDVEILETHHRHKRDAPSGTALAIAESVAAARGQSSDWRERIHESAAGPRAPGSIGMAVLRGGSVPGEHSVQLFGEDERIELRHLAEHRRLFARGALLAARRLAGRPAGWYQFDEVLWS